MTYTASWRSPSNIALIKYWGKHGLQLPHNPSLSLTLSACHTDMQLQVSLEAPSPGLVVFYNGQPAPSFEPKIKAFLSRLENYFPWITQVGLEIDSHNTFPHGAGIASSASAMSAFALCLLDINDQIGISENLREVAAKKTKAIPDHQWRQLASEIARLGSGSACRSVYPIASLWGLTADVPSSSDSFAIPWGDEVAWVYKNYQDTILIVNASEKQISSTVGHAMMEMHTYANARYEQARQNIAKLIRAMHDKDSMDHFISVVESEALQLHGMMLSGNNPFILMEPGTISIIKEVWRFRKETGIPVCFTLDAGPNVHLLYPQSHRENILDWVKNELIQYCHDGKYLLDHVGLGPEKINKTP